MSADDNMVGLVVLGSGVVAASALAWRVASHRVDGSTALSSVWVFPVPSLEDRFAVVSNPFRAPTSDVGKATQHLGVDVMYRRRDARDLIAVYPLGSPGGTAMFFMPENIPALAASAGVVTFANATPVGNTVIVGHANGWATYYAHLATLAVKRGNRVVAGQELGAIGASPQDRARLRHLHFELWADGARAGAIDPAPYLAAWSRKTIGWSPTSSISVPPSPRNARNAALTAYRHVGSAGEPYPGWVRDLRGMSGVYVIREIDGPIVYVGSSVGRLYETLTRHFQRWRRYKGFWRGQFAEGADPGLTYKRSSGVGTKVSGAGNSPKVRIGMNRVDRWPFRPGTWVTSEVRL